MSLLGQLVRGEMVAFAVRRGSGLVQMSRFIVIFGCAVMWALRHNVFLSVLLQTRRSYRPIHPPSTVTIVPVT